MNFSVLILAMILVSCHALAYGGDHMEHSRVRRAPISIEKFLDGFKEILRTGNDTLGIPKLDPFEADQLPLDIKHKFLTLNAVLTDVNAVGISDYEVKKGTFTMVGLKITVALNFPHISATTGYAMKGVAADNFPVFGLGVIKVGAKNLYVECEISLKVKSLRLQVKTMTSTVSLGALDFTATGLLDDEQLSKMLSAIISDMVPGLIEDYQTEITGLVNQIATDKLNEILGSMTIKDLLELLK